MRNELVAFLLALSAAPIGLSQTQPMLTAAPAVGFAGAFSPRVVTGRPYSAQQDSEMTQTLADGTHIHQPASSVKLYRDSQGRTRTERSFNMPNLQSVPVMIDIFDPVAQVRYTFDAQTKVAHRHDLSGSLVANGAGRPSMQAPPPPPPPPPPSMVNSPSPSRPQVRSTKLDPKTMEGILVEGRLMTVTYPVGSIGNDRELVSTTETWTSPDLQVTILSKSNDPRSGERTQSLTNISRNEPDPSLFQPPPGYTITDQDTSSDGITFTPRR